MNYILFTELILAYGVAMFIGYAICQVKWLRKTRALLESYDEDDCLKFKANLILFVEQSLRFFK